MSLELVFFNITTVMHIHMLTHKHVQAKIISMQGWLKESEERHVSSGNKIPKHQVGMMPHCGMYAFCQHSCTIACMVCMPTARMARACMTHMPAQVPDLALSHAELAVVSSEEVKGRQQQAGEQQDRGHEDPAVIRLGRAMIRAWLAFIGVVQGPAGRLLDVAASATQEAHR